jgi:hypothetical protein
MLKWLIKRRLAAFERSYDYDASYARDVLETDMRAFLKFSKLMGLKSYRKGAPVEAWYAAGLAATIAEDCGPCTQLSVTMAEREGVPAAVLKAVVAGNDRALPPDAALGYRFARAVLAHDPAADELRAEVVRRWGRKGLVSLTFAIAAARLFPTVKYALGHGQACRRVLVEGVPVAPLKQAA